MVAGRFTHKKLIVKADDFGRGPFMDPWRRFVDVCLDCGVSPSIGIVGSDFRINKEAIALGRYFREAFSIEFWNHSLNHKDVRKLTSEERVHDTKACQEIIRETLGAEPAVYGAPFNYIDRDSVIDINSCGDLRGFFFADDAADIVSNIPLKSMCTPEIGTQFLSPVRYAYFKNIIERREYPALTVVQVHPSYWVDESFAEFRDVLRLLIGKAYQSMSAMEYFSWAAVSAGQTAELDAGSATALSERIYNFSTVAGSAIPPGFSDADREYYFGRYRRGLIELSVFLRRHGLTRRPTRDSTEVLDIGAGVANWSVAAASAARNVRVTAVDRTAWMLDLARTLTSELGLGDRIQFVEGQAERLIYPDESFDFIICNNAINYMPAQDVLSESGRVLREDGLAMFGVQNILHPLQDILRSLRSGDSEGALGYIQRVFSCIAGNFGISVPRRFVTYWTDQQFITMAKYAGFQPMLRGVALPQDAGSLAGVRSMWGYVFLRSAPSWRRGVELRSGQGSSGQEVDWLIAAGSTGLAAEILLQRPQLSENVKLLSPLFRSLLRNDAGCAQVFYESLLSATPASVQVDFSREIKFSQANSLERWDDMLSYMDNASGENALQHACVAWFDSYYRRRTRPLAHPMLGRDRIFAALYLVGQGLIASNNSAVTSGVEALFDSLANRTNVIALVSGLIELPPDLDVSTIMDSDVHAEKQKWLSGISSLQPFGAPSSPIPA